jgi:DoxX-like family
LHGGFAHVTALPNTISSSAASNSTKMVWAGRILTGLLTLFFVFDGSAKLAKAKVAVDGTVKVGYPESLVVPIGLTLLACLILYLIPRASILGAILLTGYLGGATATMVRVESPLFLFPIGFGVLVWLGLYLRDERLRSMVPLRKS